jgi:hypothetical protein
MQRRHASGVFVFLRRVVGVRLPTSNSEDAGRSGKFVLHRPSTFSRAVLFAFVCVVLLLLALFGHWFVGSVCDEAHITTSFQAPFSTVCHRIFLRDLFLKNTTGYAI